MKRALLAGAAGIVALAGAMPGGAAAQAVQGLYVGAGAGASWLSETNASIFPLDPARLATPSDHFNRSWEIGYAGVLSVGYGFLGGFRVELEGFYRANEADKGLVFTRPASSGSVATYGLMANAFYDMAFFGPDAVVPYVGGGFGYAWTDWSNVGGRAGTAALTLDGSDGTWAYQGIVGVAFPIAAVPGLAVTAEYRYFATFDNPEISGRVSDTTTGAGRGVSVPVATSSHNAMLGLRYNFGRTAPAAAPPPVMALTPARTFLVFFDWNRADLTARARQIIAEAVQARTRQALTRIEVSGHTDTSGSARYNQGLSERRAAAVAAELVRLGVPRNEIVTRGFGQTQLLVATADNTREPQNRRVEIILR